MSKSKQAPAVVYESVFVPGDVVRMKHGGPQMTVVEVFPAQNRALCWYQDAHAVMRSEHIPFIALSKLPQ